MKNNILGLALALSCAIFLEAPVAAMFDGYKSKIVIASASTTQTHLSPEQQEFVTRFKQLELDSIIDMGPGETTCKNLGQEAFDFFKNKCGGNSYEAFRKLQQIVDAVWFSDGDGRLRKQYIERALARVGDDVVQWIP